MADEYDQKAAELDRINTTYCELCMAYHHDDNLPSSCIKITWEEEE